MALFKTEPSELDWLDIDEKFNVSYHILVASLTLMALFKTEPSELDWLHIDEKLF